MKNLYKYLQTCKFGRLGRKYLKPSENWGQIMWEGKNYPGKNLKSEQQYGEITTTGGKYFIESQQLQHLQLGCN